MSTASWLAAEVSLHKVTPVGTVCTTCTMRLWPGQRLFDRDAVASTSTKLVKSIKCFERALIDLVADSCRDLMNPVDRGLLVVPAQRPSESLPFLLLAMAESGRQVPYGHLLCYEHLLMKSFS